MWQQFLDLAFSFLESLSAIGTLISLWLLVVEPIRDAIAKGAKARRYRQTLVSEAVPKSGKRTR